MIRIVLPHHLRRLSGTGRELALEVPDPPTQAATIDALEAAYPMLFGTIRDPATQRRRPFVRFFACGADLSHDPPETRLPDAVVTGEEPLHIVGAMAGG